MRTVTIPAAVLSLACCSLIVFACSQDTPQPLDVDSAAPRAQLMSPLDGRLPIGPNYDGRTLVVTSKVIAQEIVCLMDSDLYNVVVIGNAKPAIPTTLAVNAGTNLSPGDRFDITTPSTCSVSHVQVDLLPN